MSRSRLLSLPPELVSLVFQHCSSFRSVLALARTCKHLHDVFQHQFGPIVWAVGLHTMYAFDVALIAVRATKIACDALRANKLPPLQDIYPIQQLSGTRRIPTRDELHGILDLQHLGRCVEHLLYLNTPRFHWLHFEPNVTVLQAAVGWPRSSPRFPEMHRMWRERLHRSIYRALVCGAALAAAYHEPFFRDEPQKPPGFLGSFLRRLKNLRPSSYERTPPDLLAKPEEDFLQQFPVYRLLDPGGNIDKDEGATFQPLADWLVDDMKRAADREGDTFALYGETLGQWPIVQQVLHCVWTLERLNTIIGVPRGTRSWRSPIIAPWLRRTPELIPGADAIGPTRTVTVIIHGVYQPEEIAMPVRPGDEFTAGGVYTRRNLISTTNKKQVGKQMYLKCDGYNRPQQLKLSAILNHLACGQPNLNGSQWNVAQLPEHRLFVYILQENCHVTTFAAREILRSINGAWRGVVSLLAFRNSIEDHLEELVQKYIPQDYTGHQGSDAQ